MLNSDGLAPKITSKDKLVSSVEGGRIEKPRTVPNSKKNFKEILGGKEDTLSEDAHDKDVAESGAKTPTMTDHSPTIFELSAQKTATDKLAAGQNIEMKPVNFNSLTDKTKFTAKPEFAQEMADLSSIEPKPNQQPDTLAAGKWWESADGQTSDSGDEGGAQSNLLAVAPPAPELVVSAEVAPVKMPAPVHEIVKQLVESITAMETKGRIDTTITLKGQFEGVQVTVSSFNTANKELNISIFNLTQEMQKLLTLNQDSLTTALNNAGIIVQMFTLTTADAPGLPTSTGQGQQPFSMRREDQQEKGQGKKGS